MRRLGPTLAGVAGGGIFCSVIFGSPVAILPFAAVALLAAALRPSRSRRHGPDRAWAAPLHPAGGPDGSPSPPARGPARPALVAGALGRVEARELVLSPWFGVGIAFCASILLVFGGIWASENGTPWAETAQLAPWFAHPLVGLTVLAVHRAVTRAGRDGTEELFDSCPADPVHRTLGFLSTAWVPVTTLAVFFLAYGVTVALRSPNVYGSLGADAAADVLGGLVLGVGGVALGVALGRWVRFALAPVVTVVAVCFASLALAAKGDPGWNPLAMLSTFPPLSDPAPVFSARPVWWHVVWIAALTVAVAALALARSSRGRAVTVAGGLALAVAVVAGVAVTRPMSSGEAAHIAGLVARPAAHQTCVGAGRSVEVCTYAGHGELGRMVAHEVGPVAAALPAGAASVTLRSALDGTLDDFPPEVTRRLPGGVPPLAAGEARLGFDASSDRLRASRLLVALSALRMPVDTGPETAPVAVAGQARGVVALWLGARGLDGDAARRLATVQLDTHDVPTEPDSFDLGNVWPSGCDVPVVWSRQDLVATRAVLALPEPLVAGVVSAGWARWADPATGTDELLAALGLAGVAPFDEVVPRGEAPEC